GDEDSMRVPDEDMVPSAEVPAPEIEPPPARSKAARVVPESERAPPDIGRAVVPAHPCGGEDRAGAPDPSVARIPRPAAVVIGRPPPGIVRDPERAVGSIVPVPVRVGSPARALIVGDPDGSVLRCVDPSAVPGQLALIGSNGLGDLRFVDVRVRSSGPDVLL